MSSVPFSAGSPPGNTTVNIPAGSAVAPPAATPGLTVITVTEMSEQTFTFPINTVRFLLKMKDPLNQSNMRMSLVSGETFLTDYITFRPASIYSEVDLKLTQTLSLFLRSDNLPFSVEVLWWTA